jgi:hypothetical protein
VQEYMKVFWGEGQFFAEKGIDEEKILIYPVGIAIPRCGFRAGLDTVYLLRAQA